jgi:hypothetical protein
MIVEIKEVHPEEIAALLGVKDSTKYKNHGLR